MRLFMLLFYLILIILAVSFAALNASDVQVNLYLIKLTMPVSVLMTIVFGIGVFIGCILFIARYWRLKAECRKLRNQLSMTEKEIKNLRSIPLQNQH